MTNTSWFGAPSLGVASVDGFVNSASLEHSLLTIGYFEVDVIDGFVKFSDAYAKIGRAVPFYVQDFVDEYRASGLLAESDLKFVPGTIGSELWAAESVIVAYLEWARCMTSGISSVDFNNINIGLLADWVSDLLESLDEAKEPTNNANLPDYSPGMTLAEIWDLQ